MAFGALTTAHGEGKLQKHTAGGHMSNGKGTWQRYMANAYGECAWQRTHDKLTIAEADGKGTWQRHMAEPQCK